MRGDVVLTLRLLLRGTGLAGLAAAIGGGVALAGALAPWHLAVAEVSMLGGEAQRTVGAMRGAPTTLGGAVVALLAIVLIGLGLTIAFDRPPPHARWWLLGVATTCVAVAVVTLWLPPLGAVAEDVDVLTALGAEGGTLPAGVEASVEARRGHGPWLVAGGGLLAAGAALLAREA